MVGDVEWLRCGQKIIFFTGPYRPILVFLRVHFGLSPILYYIPLVFHGQIIRGVFGTGLFVADLPLRPHHRSGTVGCPKSEGGS